MTQYFRNFWKHSSSEYEERQKESATKAELEGLTHKETVGLVGDIVNNSLEKCNDPKDSYEKGKCYFLFSSLVNSIIIYEHGTGEDSETTSQYLRDKVNEIIEEH